MNKESLFPSRRSSVLMGFIGGLGVASAAAYYFAIRPLTLGAEVSAQAGFMLIQERARELEQKRGSRP